MSTEQSQRDAIVQRAKGEASLWTSSKLDASKPVGAYRQGGAQLAQYFTTAFPAYPRTRVVNYTGPVSDSPKVKGGLTNWCGVFALYCLHAAEDESIGAWSSTSITMVSGLSQTKDPQYGDIGFIERHPKAADGTTQNITHYIVVTAVNGSGPDATISTVEGNFQPSHSQLISTVAENTRKKSDVTLFYTLFGTQSADAARKKLSGKWRVKIGWKPWIYHFIDGDRVAYREDNKPLTQDDKSAAGSWKISGTKLVIAWPGGSRDEWELPVRGYPGEPAEMGSWYSAEQRRDSIVATKSL